MFPGPVHPGRVDFLIEIISSETFCAVLFFEVVFSVEGSERENHLEKDFLEKSLLLKVKHLLAEGNL